MNKTWKKRWIKALTSGEYKQTQGRLRRNDSYCCLGVLCDIISPKEWVVKRPSKNKCYRYLGSDALLPYNILKETNINRSSQASLTKMNDTYKYSFIRIAKWIDKNL